MFSFFVFNQKYVFCANLVQNVRIIRLSWNSVASLIRICRIQWCCSLFSFSTGNTLFWANLVQKIKIISLSWNLLPRLTRIWRIQWWCSLFLFLTGNTLLSQIWSKKSKLSVESPTLTFQTKMCYLLHWKHVKNDKKCFLFHLNSSFRSQDI